MGLFRKKELTLKQEEDRKHVRLELSKKSGEPVLGYAFPKDIEDRVRKIRDQAKDLRVMAERLDQMAIEIEKAAPRGRMERFVSRYFRKRTTAGTG